MCGYKYQISWSVEPADRPSLRRHSPALQQRERPVQLRVLPAGQVLAGGGEQDIRCDTAANERRAVQQAVAYGAYAGAAAARHPQKQGRAGRAAGGFPDNGGTMVGSEKGQRILRSGDRTAGSEQHARAVIQRSVAGGAVGIHVFLPASAMQHIDTPLRRLRSVQTRQLVPGHPHKLAAGGDIDSPAQLGALAAAVKLPGDEQLRHLPPIPGHAADVVPQVEHDAVRPRPADGPGDLHGSIRKRKDGRWEGRYTAGHDPETGKAIYKNVLGKTQAEVKEKLKQAIEETQALDITKAGKYTVGEWMEMWFQDYAKIKVRPSSHQTYQGYIHNHIRPNIGDIPLEKLTSLDLQKFYKKLLTEGRVDRVEAKGQPKGLSAKTVRNIHQILSSALKLAQEQRLILTNPAEGCALPRVEHQEMKTLTTVQLASFFREVRDSGVFELYYLELATGLRRGELLGLKWEDVDLERGDLRVRRQVSRINGEVVEAPLKTKNAYRTLPLAEDTVSVLKEQRRKVGSSPWVFPSPNGGPISPDSVLHMLHRVLKRAGLPKVRFHDLRHTFATLALQNGVDVKTVSGMLGHFSAGFTLDTYAHITSVAQRQAAQTMGNVLAGTIEG